MMRTPPAETGRLDAAREPADRLRLGLSDCWLIGVMPPCWTLAYSRLLTAGETRPGFGNRIP